MSDIAAGELRRSRLWLESVSRRSPVPVFRAQFPYEPHPDGATDRALGFVRPDREAEIGAAYAEFARRLGR